MSEIRVTYSGLISLVTGLASVLPGMLFTLIVTRTLTTVEFGTWSLIYGLTIYVAMMEPVISYWVTRETARGIKSGKTAILTSSVLSLGGILVYAILAYFLGYVTHLDLNILFFAASLIPLMFLYSTLNGINLGSKPHALSYGMLSFSISEILSALIFVYLLHMGVLGVILSILVAYVVSIAVQLIFAREKIKNKIIKNYVKKWLKFFWLPLYPGITRFLYNLDFVIFLAITGSVEGLAFWTASSTLSVFIQNSGLISKAVYPKLLQGQKTEYVRENITQLFYFAIPMTALIITFVKPGLFILNPVYGIAAPITIILAISTFFYTLSNVFQSYLIGIEKVDMDEKSTFSDYVKSKLFFVPTITLIQYGIYLTLLGTGLLLLGSTRPHLDLLIYWSVALLVTQIPFTIYFYVQLRRTFVVTLELNSVLKYLLVSIGTFAMINVLTEHFLVYKNNIFEFVPNVLFFIVLGITIYFVITYFIDSRTRKLFHAVIKEIKG